MGSSKSKAVLLHGIYIRVTECHAVSSPTDVDGIQTDSSLSTVTQWLSYSICNGAVGGSSAAGRHAESKVGGRPHVARSSPEIDPKETSLVLIPPQSRHLDTRQCHRLFCSRGNTTI